MTIVRLSSTLEDNGKYRVEAYHEHAEVLTEEQKQGTIEIPNGIPARPKNIPAGHNMTLTADSEGNIEWYIYEDHSKPEIDMLVKLVKNEKISLEDIEDEAIRMIVESELE